MMKRFFYFLLFPLCIALVACSDSDDYNADTAKSPYKPLVEGVRKVAQVKTTNTVDGRDYSWEHNFEYDAQGRIKEINSAIQHHYKSEEFGVERWYLCNIRSKANYYFKGNKLEVDYRVEREYPEYPDWNSVDSGSNYGTFNDDGMLEDFASIDFVYSATSLQSAYLDGGVSYEFSRSRGNITGFVKYFAPSDTVIKDRRGNYTYRSTKNNTNFDFAAYFGYWEVEQNIYVNRSPYYAAYQLGAFGMLGAISPNLPDGQLKRDSKGELVLDEYGQTIKEYGEWKFDGSGYPLWFVDASGRKTEIKYVEQ